MYIHSIECSRLNEMNWVTGQWEISFWYFKSLLSFFLSHAKILSSVKCFLCLWWTFNIEFFFVDKIENLWFKLCQFMMEFHWLYKMSFIKWGIEYLIASSRNFVNKLTEIYFKINSKIFNIQKFIATTYSNTQWNFRSN